MLNSLRRHATGWVAKVLFGILVVSFAIWGIGDIFRAPQAAARWPKSPARDITVREVSNEFDGRVRQMQQQFGANLDRRAAVSLGVMQQARRCGRGAAARGRACPRPRAHGGGRHGGGDDPAESIAARASAGSSASASNCCCAASA